MPTQMIAPAIRVATAHDAPAIASLLRTVFGPGRHVRAAERVRESAALEPALAFVGESSGRLIATCACSHILIGPKHALLLGPLAVDPALKNEGWGRALLHRTETAATKAGYNAICLVGDRPYYARSGYEPVPHGQIRFDHPVDPDRILVRPLNGHTVTDFAGRVRGSSGTDPWTGFSVPRDTRSLRSR